MEVFVLVMASIYATMLLMALLDWVHLWPPSPRYWKRRVGETHGD